MRDILSQACATDKAGTQDIPWVRTIEVSARQGNYVSTENCLS